MEIKIKISIYEDRDRSCNDGGRGKAQRSEGRSQRSEVRGQRSPRLNPLRGAPDGAIQLGREVGSQ